MPLDHVSLGVADMQRAQAFYDKALAPLGMTGVMPVTVGGALVGVGYGDTPDRPVFWIGLPIDGQAASAGNGVHVCFTAPSRAAVDAFYAAAIAAGARDDGAPGVRAHYHPSYYAAFVRDLDGAKIEAVCHAPG